MRWDFFVRHYAIGCDAGKSDPKYRRDDRGVPVDGVLYPRAGTSGGCTAHNAMILIYPHNADWDRIAELTGDASWRADKMRGYFERIENCDHRPLERSCRRSAEPIRTAGTDGCRPRRRFPQPRLSNRDAA